MFSKMMNPNNCDYELGTSFFMEDEPAHHFDHFNSEIVYPEIGSEEEEFGQY